MEPPKASTTGERARARVLPLGTRGRLVAAFAVVAAAILGAFSLQLARLRAMERGITELVEHQEQMQLALALEDAVRDEYDLRLRALAGEAVVIDDAEETRVAELMGRLARGVDEPEALVWVDALRAATEALEARCRADFAEHAAGRPLPPGAEKERYALVFQVEENVDRLFAFLRERLVVQSASVEALRRETLHLVMAFVVTLPLFALALGLHLSRAIGRPLARLGDGAARIGSGDLTTRVALEGPAELAALAADLNAMAAALEHHQDRLVRSEKLAGLGRLAAGVAHEINNPLQVMLGYLTLHRGRVPGELGEHLARVEREAMRCKDIVEAMLQLSRPPASGPPEAVDLREISREVVEAVRVAMPDAPEVRVDGAGAALGSAARYRQVIFNLVKNAAEAAGPAGRVRIEVGCDEAGARVVVSDSGPGIPPDLRDRVFEPFFTTKSSGTGLGLALARAIAQAHGGDVELEDAREGTRFSLRAPRSNEGRWP